MRSAPGQKCFDGRAACRLCGRTLVGERSIERGYGPTCYRKVQKCRVCGCTHLTPCPEGCYWVEDDLCSACAEAASLAAETEEAAAVDEPQRTRRTQRKKT
jgi:hypothetical protein